MANKKDSGLRFCREDVKVFTAPELTITAHVRKHSEMDLVDGHLPVSFGKKLVFPRSYDVCAPGPRFLFSKVYIKLILNDVIVVCLWLNNPM